MRRKAKTCRGLTKTFEALNSNITIGMKSDGNNLRAWQRQYVFGGLAIAAACTGALSAGADHAMEGRRAARCGGPEGREVWKRQRCRAIVRHRRIDRRRARVHATHERALAGQFAKQLSEHIGRPVEWKVLGKNGVTARRTIDELLPQMPDEKFDYILVGIGGNDVMKLLEPAQMAARYDRAAGDACAKGIRTPLSLFRIAR